MEQRDLEALYTRMERRLYNVVYRQLWSKDDALDVVQESFVRLWKMKDVRAETVEALVFRIALNLAKNRRRSRRIWKWVPLGETLVLGGKLPDEALHDGRAQDRMRRALDALPKELADVLIMTELSELSYQDVAAALGIAEGTVGSRRNTALAKVKELLDAVR